MSTETDPSKIKKRKGKCRNFEGGDCVKAEVGEIQEIPSNELFVCQDCKQPLTEISGGGNKKALPFILGGGGLLAVLLGWLILGGTTPPPPSPLETFPLLVPGIVDQRLKQNFDPGQATDFEISQPLPAGLQLDKIGYSIQGTPTAVGETLLTLQGLNSEGKVVVEYEVTISITKPVTSSASSTTSSTGEASPSDNPIAVPYEAIGELLFEQGSSDLRGEQIEDLNEMGNRLKSEFQDCKYLVVTGYASREGDEGSNKRLSQERAKNVARELKALGIPQKVFVQPEGEATQGRPDDQLARDRRVTINVYRN